MSRYNRVRVGATYIYHPVLIDKVHPPYDIKDGDVVRVFNMLGCPKANTMGHCYVQHLDGKRFAGLVCCNSLQEVLIASDGTVHLREQRKVAGLRDNNGRSVEEE